MSVDQLMQQALSLPNRLRLQLVEGLLASLDAKISSHLKHEATQTNQADSYQTAADVITTKVDLTKQLLDIEQQLTKITKSISLLKAQTQDRPFWQRSTHAERAHQFHEWTAQLPKTGISLPNEAFDRGNIYD